MPVEVEKLITRPDITSHFAHVLSSNLSPLIERQVKEVVNKTFLPVYTQQSSNLHQEVLREFRGEIHRLKGELTSYQTEMFRSYEVCNLISVCVTRRSSCFRLRFAIWSTLSEY